MLEIVSVRKMFVNSTKPILDSVSVKIEDGEFFSLLGPSGCGKTTLLRILAGLETPDAGQIFFDGIDITNLPAQKRPFRMVFQRHALFPHLTVFENVAFGLKIDGGLDRSQIHERVKEVLELVQMSAFKDRRPDTLSGGQSQRVALARALACRPKVVLLDEPLSALDQRLRENMQVELRALQKRLGIIFVFVTHDQQEAFSMSDRVAVMSEGQFEQISDPQSLYLRPRSLFSAQFVGTAASLPLDQVQCLQDDRVEFSYDQQTLRGVRQGAGDTVRSYALIRPECLRLETQASRSSDHESNRLPATVVESTFRGPWVEIRVRTLAGHSLSVYEPIKNGCDQWKPGTPVELLFDPADTQIFHSALDLTSDMSPS